MKRSIISTIAATVLLGFAGMLAAADSLAAMPAMPEISIPAFDETADIEEAVLSPTICRIVEFTPSEACAKKHGPDPVPAIITRVHNDTCVNLKVLWDDPETEHVTSVVLDESDAPAPMTWRWPKRV